MAELDLDDPLSVIDYPRLVIERIEGVLAFAGIELPLVGVQIGIFAVAVLLLALSLRRAWPKPLDAPLALIASLASGLLVLFVAAFWIGGWLWPLPGIVTGTVEAGSVTMPADLRVKLLDARGREIQTEGGRVDTTNGRFSLAYAGGAAARPQVLLLTTGECAPQQQQLSLPRLRVGADIVVSFDCREDR